MTEHEGGCHCGNIRVRLHLSTSPGTTPLRTCTCTFCRSHVTRMTADPAGMFELAATDWSEVQRYRFGTGTIDFIICRRCGVFIAALSESSTAVVNVNCLADRDAFTSEPVVKDFAGETLEVRLARRAASWMPARIVELRA